MARIEEKTRSEYDFSQSRKNPYAELLTRAVTIRLDIATLDYFEKTAAELGLRVQT